MKKLSWGHGIFIVYTLFALSTISFVVFAMSRSVDLVSDQYYKQELEYQQTIDQMSNALSLAEQPTVVVTSDQVRIEFPASASATKGTVHMYRPSNPAMDRSYDLKIQHGAFSIAKSELASGRWRVKMRWNDGKESYHIDKQVEL